MQTKKLLTIITIFCLFWAGNSCYGQTAEELFPKAIQLEEVNGELEEAINIYENIVNDSTCARIIAAKAQLHIGMCYEKLGKIQAKKAYETVIEIYKDQPEIIEIAKKRLQNLNKVNSTIQKTQSYKVGIKEISIRQDIKNWEILRKTPFDFSPDGKKIVFLGTHKDSLQDKFLHERIFVADASGVPINLLNDPPVFENEARPTFSPDGKYIAFVGVTKNVETGNDGAIYIVDANGGKPIQVSAKFKRGETFGLIWTPDSKHVSYHGKDGIMTSNFNGDTTCTIPLNFDFSIRLSGYSPDGKWISYHKSNSGDPIKSEDCWLISTSGNKQIRITDSEGFDGYGTWSKAYCFYFVSDRNGDRNIFRLKIDPETGEKSGEAEQITHYYDASVLAPRFINEKSGLAYVLLKKETQILISENENFDDFKIIAMGRDPTISPGGDTVYFVGAGKDNQGIYSTTRNRGIKRKLTGISPFNPQLSPDGTVMAFFNTISEDRQELCFLSVKDSRLLKSLKIETGNALISSWSPDSKRIVYAVNNELFIVPVWGKFAEKINTIQNGFWSEPASIRWSPDGNSISGSVHFQGDVDNSVAIVSVKKGEFKRLTFRDEPGNKENIVWHPNGKKLTYMYYEPPEVEGRNAPDDYDQIREVKIDGTPSTELFDQPHVWDYVGTWAPDGENFYFLGNQVEREGFYLYRFNAISKEFKFFPESYGLSLPIFSKNKKHAVSTRQETGYELWIMEGIE